MRKMYFFIYVTCYSYATVCPPVYGDNPRAKSLTSRQTNITITCLLKFALNKLRQPLAFWIRLCSDHLETKLFSILSTKVEQISQSMRKIYFSRLWNIVCPPVRREYHPWDIVCPQAANHSALF